MMIEQMARAMIVAVDPDRNFETNPYYDVERNYWDHVARAALTALLEPSEGMVSVATMFDIENGRGGWVNMTESAFYEFNGQLIRAALDEKEG